MSVRVGEVEVDIYCCMNPMGMTEFPLNDSSLGGLLGCKRCGRTLAFAVREIVNVDKDALGEAPGDHR